MAAIRNEIVLAAIIRASALTDPNIHNDITKRYEFRKQTLLDDESLTADERTEAIKKLTINYDHNKLLFNEGTKRRCENCSLECLATSYCEHCVRNYLKNNFSNWTSGNSDIDDLIKECQIRSFRPDKLIEWIPYKNLQNIEYMTKGGCNKIYSANWISGEYVKWNSKERQLERSGTFKVVLKELGNIEAANRSWFDEAKSHLILSNKYTDFVRCCGLTQDSSSGNYMLVMHLLDMDLRKYSQKHQCTWEEKIHVVWHLIVALRRIHYNDAIHRDLHSGNVLYSQHNNSWYISDFGFCGPADKPLKSVYGNLPYVAPEVIIGKECTFESDIYSFGILMWEISSGQIPFCGCEHNYNLAMRIVNGMRPSIRSKIPSEYEESMKQCWDADPLKRPDLETLYYKIQKMWHDIQNGKFNTSEYNDSSQIQSNSNSHLYLLSMSKFYQFENLPEPKNATEGEQEEFHSKPYDFEIPNNI